MEINGVMIDCARLLGLPQYYYRLLEFMAQWKINTLTLHFSDDHGCALNLPGFEKLAMSRAWEPDELQEFLSFAASRGIEVIPELDAFGHTRYITDTPEYPHLFAGKRTKEMDLEWDRTRYPDDPQKYGAYFPNESNQYAMLIIKQLVDDMAINRL